MSSRTLFDAYLVVDWSANQTPKTGKDSIWTAEALRSRTGLRLLPPRNLATRSHACELVSRSLVDHVHARRRVLVAFDFVYAFPRGFAEALGLAGPEPLWLRVWRDLAQRIEDDDSNRNNRWVVAAELNRRLGPPPGPFWNCPRAVATPELCVTKGSFPYVVREKLSLAEYRIADQRLRRSGRIVQSVWKLFTPGSVGSQTLLGIPRLHAFRTDPRLAPWSRVWPFETGFTASPSPESGPFILHAEAWPRIVPTEGDPAMILDARQVITLARHLAELDVGGKLAALFERPAALDDEEVEVCRQEEGWILGA